MDVKIERSDVSSFLWLQNIVEDAIVDHLTEKWANIYFSREKDYLTWLFGNSKYKNAKSIFWLSEKNRFVFTDAYSFKEPRLYILPIDSESISIDFDKKEKLFTIHYREYMHIPSSEQEFKKIKHMYSYSHKENYVDASIKITLDEILALFR